MWTYNIWIFMFRILVIGCLVRCVITIILSLLLYHRLFNCFWFDWFTIIDEFFLHIVETTPLFSISRHIKSKITCKLAFYKFFFPHRFIFESRRYLIRFLYCFFLIFLFSLGSLWSNWILILSLSILWWLSMSSWDVIWSFNCSFFEELWLLFRKMFQVSVEIIKFGGGTLMAFYLFR